MDGSVHRPSIVVADPPFQYKIETKPLNYVTTSAIVSFTSLHRANAVNNNVTLSPCAVDSLNPSDRHSQHPLFTRILTTSLSSARPIGPILISAIISSIHLFLGRPLLLPSPHANIISFSRPSALITCRRTI